jgi:hypothetical protein
VFGSFGADSPVDFDGGYAGEPEGAGGGSAGD